MKIISIIVLLFIAVPLMELAILIKIAGMTSLGWALLLVITTGLIGGILARREGLAVLHATMRSLQGGMMPTDHIIEGMIVLVAAAFLITPGILTDIAGFILLAPVTRRRIREYLKRYILRWLSRSSTFTIHRF